MAILITDNKVDPDYSYSAVPEHARMNKASLTMTWWSLCSAMIWLLISATLAVNYGSANTLIGLVLSVILYGVVNGIGSVWSKVSVAIVVGFVVFGLMLTDVFSFLLQALAYQGVFVVAWGVIVLTHIFFGDTSDATLSIYDKPSLPEYKLGAIMAWVIPSLTGVFLMSSSVWLSQYAVIVTMFLSFSIYYFSISCFCEKSVVV